jgi:hypothetical protein
MEGYMLERREQAYLRDMEHEIARLREKAFTLEQRAALAERSAREAWQFAKTVLRTSGYREREPAL